MSVAAFDCTVADPASHAVRHGILALGCVWQAPARVIHEATALAATVLTDEQAIGQDGCAGAPVAVQ